MEKMLVTKALNELKLLDARIIRETRNAIFVAAAKTAENKVNAHTTKEDFYKEAKAAYQSINDLIDRRAKIKAAIVSSNAATMVEVNGEKMSVADAIELKTAIDYKRNLLITMKNQLEKAKSNANIQNIELEDRIDKYIESMLGKEAKSKKEDYSEMIEPIRTANEYSLVDPINIELRIDELEKYIEGFLSEVDSVLQISNCITWIEF